MARKPILVVEDDVSIRLAVAYCLRKSGYAVLLAASGTEALAHIRETDPNLIILDLSLPQMDGFSLMGHLRANTGLSTAKVIVLTAFEDEWNRQRSFELGAKRFITKPFSPRDLVVAVGEVISAHETSENRKPFLSGQSLNR